MRVGSRVRAMERRAHAAGAELCRCSKPILGIGPGEERRVFAGLRDYYDGTIHGEPLPPIPLRADGTPEPVPERCRVCGRIIDYVRVRVG